MGVPLDLMRQRSTAGRSGWMWQAWGAAIGAMLLACKAYWDRCHGAYGDVSGQMSICKVPKQAHGDEKAAEGLVAHGSHRMLNAK